MPICKKPHKPPCPRRSKKQFEERRGYANFYFNRENVERVWKSLQARGDFSAAAGKWTLKGEVRQALKGQPARSGPAVIHLGDEECNIELPTGDTKITISDEMDFDLNPPGSGGLLPTLHLWRKLLLGSPGKYGAVTYLGAAPLPQRQGLYDVLLGVGERVDTLFYCNPADGTLECMEMYPDEESDPCEVYFGDYRQEQGRLLPHRIEARFGDQVFGVFTLNDLSFEPPPEK